MVDGTKDVCSKQDQTPELCDLAVKQFTIVFLTFSVETTLQLQALQAAVAVLWLVGMDFPSATPCVRTMMELW